MRDHRFDDIARLIGAIEQPRTNRRTLLRALGIGMATAITGSAATAIAQDATPSPEIPAAPTIRLPAGHTSPRSVKYGCACRTWPQELLRNASPPKQKKLRRSLA